VSEFQNVGPLKIKAPWHLEKFFSRHTVGTKLIYDHGCGYGGWTNHMSMLTGANIAIFDPDADGCAYTKNLLGDRIVESDGPFDTIMCFGVLELLEELDQIALLKKFANSLRDQLLIQYNFYNRFALRWIALKVKHGNPINWHEKNRFHRTYFLRNYVEAMFAKAGFRIVEKCHPTLKNHLPHVVNNKLGPIVPSHFHMTFYYALEKAQ
jgi:SAM-dependent methyltransferase